MTAAAPTSVSHPVIEGSFARQRGHDHKRKLAEPRRGGRSFGVRHAQLESSFNPDNDLNDSGNTFFTRIISESNC